MITCLGTIARAILACRANVSVRYDDAPLFGSTYKNGNSVR
jgi:hypothetical protein